MNFSSDPINNLENLITKNKTKSISIYLMVITVFIGFMACLPIINMDISSQSRGVIRAKQDNVPISTIVSGKITQLHLKNNQNVTAGDTLLTITTEALNSQKGLNDTLLTTNQSFIEDFSSLLQNNFNQLKTTKAKETYYEYTAKLNELSGTVALKQKNYTRQKTLYDKGVIARAEFENHTFELENAKQILNFHIKQQRTQWETQKQALEERLKNLKNNSEKLTIEANNYVLIAPISGSLEGVLGLQVGSFINASQTIASISPNQNLIVENNVSPNDMGLLKIGQKTTFQLDAFNYNQWGMLTGEVIDIDKNITLQENTTFFKVRCRLYTTQLALKSGYQTNVSKGMTLTTHYFITRRSLFDLLFDKTEDWFNPKLLN